MCAVVENPPCKHFTTLHKYNTEFNADSVEWCPHDPFQNIFVCANYQLINNKEKQDRYGCILLFSVSDSLNLNQIIKTAGILDQKWCHNQVAKHSILAVANASKTIEIYRLNPELVQLEILARFKITDDDSETLVLSLDWSTGQYHSNEPELVCSDSRGKIHTFKLVNNELIKVDCWKAHDYEAWITAFYYWDTNTILTGGDDGKFLKFDKRLGTEPVACNRSHQAGVTAIHSNAKREFVLSTGSYDEYVRLWDIRHLKNCHNSMKMPGPLWRIKWDPFSCKYLLAACMLGGLHIVETESNLKIVDSFYEHRSIVYGGDWCFKEMTKPLIASCSFYDNLLCISTTQLDK